MIQTIIVLHNLFALLFCLYIVIDRAYIRIFVKEKSREKFYKKIRIPMLFISLVLIISGAILLVTFFSIWTLFKAILALSLIAAFFYCPLFMKKEVSSFKRFMYRYFVVILTLLTVSLGLYI